MGDGQFVLPVPGNAITSQKRRQQMYYRIAIQRGRDHLEWPVTWQWKSTALSSLQSLFQLLRFYGALPQEQLRVLSSPSREGLEEQLRQENKGLASTSVTAAQFLRERMLRSPTVVRSISERERGTSLERGAIAVISQPAVNERGGEGSVLESRGMSALERRREELESGSGSDHDLPHSFSLPLFLPQVLAWMTSWRGCSGANCTPRSYSRGTATIT